MSTTVTITQPTSTQIKLTTEESQIAKILHDELTQGIPAAETLLKLHAVWDDSVPHAPKRTHKFSQHDFELAISNALRYFPPEVHNVLALEFAEELKKYGHIYMYRLRPTTYEMKAYPISQYPAKCTQAAAIMLMIQNNLDVKVAQYPHELVTYGGNGSVFSNWGQYRLVMKYLSEMTEEQTLVMYSGHPLGLFPSHKDAPRVVVTNGMVIPNYSSKLDYEKMYALGVSMYGQMTAGSYCYIGPQGIVHGTTITVLNAGRKYLGSEDLSGKVFVSSGLGGMSGAQGKAGTICGAVSVIAEVNESALIKRYKQGWIMSHTSDLEDCVARIKQGRTEKKPLSIGYLGNIVDLLERLAKEDTLLVDLGSDQTSLHNPYNGGYYPVGLSFQEANKMMVEDPAKFKELVQESLRRHVTAINTLVQKGMKFWDYGNSFLLEASRAGADVMASDGRNFKFPSYVQDIMGDIFSLGFGPFRWVCTSGLESDLVATDQIAAEVIQRISKSATERSQKQFKDNLTWIQQAHDQKLVVGSQARILYSDAEGRATIALEFNEAVRQGRLKGPVVISRDHHDVSGADSPFRETSNIYDGSSFCADMAVQNCIGDSFRGATWVALHNGGGTGWGEAINGGFGLVLDGSEDASRRAKQMLQWDVLNGVTRRAWAKNENAEETIKKAMEQDPKLKVTLPYHTENSTLENAFKQFQQ